MKQKMKKLMNKNWKEVSIKSGDVTYIITTDFQNAIYIEGQREGENIPLSFHRAIEYGVQMFPEHNCKDCAKYKKGCSGVEGGFVFPNLMVKNPCWKGV
jgi:hypothetical protein